MSLRDIVNKMPSTKGGLRRHVNKKYHYINDLADSDPKYRQSLATSVEDSHEKFSPYFSNLSGKMSALGHGIGYVADYWFFTTGDILGCLGGKFIHLILQVPEKVCKAPVYASETGDVKGGVQNVAEGLLSYLPGCTILDQGLKRIAQKRMVKEAVSDFDKDIKVYKEKDGATEGPTDGEACYT